MMLFKDFAKELEFQFFIVYNHHNIGSSYYIEVVTATSPEAHFNYFKYFGENAMLSYMAFGAIGGVERNIELTVYVRNYADNASKYTSVADFIKWDELSQATKKGLAASVGLTESQAGGIFNTFSYISFFETFNNGLTVNVVELAD